MPHFICSKKCEKGRVIANVCEDTAKLAVQSFIEVAEDYFERHIDADSALVEVAGPYPEDYKPRYPYWFGTEHPDGPNNKVFCVTGTSEIKWKVVNAKKNTHAD